MNNKKGLELFTVSLSCKTCLPKFNFWSGPLNLETGKERKKHKTLDISKEQKMLVRGNKNNF